MTIYAIFPLGPPLRSIFANFAAFGSRAWLAPKHIRSKSSSLRINVHPAILSSNSQCTLSRSKGGQILPPRTGTLHRRAKFVDSSAGNKREEHDVNGVRCGNFVLQVLMKKKSFSGSRRWRKHGSHVQFQNWYRWSSRAQF